MLLQKTLNSYKRISKEEKQKLLDNYGKTSDEKIREILKRLKVLVKEDDLKKKFYELKQVYFQKIQEEPRNPLYAILDGGKFAERNRSVSIVSRNFSRIKILTKNDFSELRVSIGEVIDQMTLGQKEMAKYIVLGELLSTFRDSQGSYSILEVYLYS